MATQTTQNLHDDRQQQSRTIFNDATVAFTSGRKTYGSHTQAQFLAGPLTPFPKKYLAKQKIDAASSNTLEHAYTYTAHSSILTVIEGSDMGPGS